MAGKRYSPQAQRLGNGPGRGASRYHLRRWIYRARRLWPDQSDRREVRAFSLLPRAAAEREGDQWSPRALYLWREGFHRVQGYSTYQPTQQLHSRLSCWISRHRWMRRQRRISDAASRGTRASREGGPSRSEERREGKECGRK